VTNFSATLAHIPQTNLQLYSQMHRIGYSQDQVVRVIKAYHFATQTFANRFRADGKPFVAHLVGTAGIMVWLQGPTTAVIAALLHAVYQEGDFGTVAAGMSKSKRKLVRHAVGSEAEALIADYTRGSRSTDGLRETYARFENLAANERLLLKIQLANELDDYRDLAALYADNSALRLKKIMNTGKIQAEMAEKLGCAELARALRETYRTTLGTTLSDSARSSHGDGYEIVPHACRLKLTVQAGRLKARVWRRLQRFFGEPQVVGTDR